MAAAIAVAACLLLLLLSCRQDPPKTLHRGEREEAAGNRGVVGVGSRPSRFSADYQRASRLEAENRLEEAVWVYLELCRKEDDSLKTTAYLGLGTAYNLSGRHQQAVQSYHTSLAYDSLNKDSYVGLGTALCDLKDYPQSEAAYQAAMRLDPASPDPHWGLAIVYKKMHDMEQAREHARKFIELAPDSKYRYVAERILSQ